VSGCGVVDGREKRSLDNPHWCQSDENLQLYRTQNIEARHRTRRGTRRGFGGLGRGNVQLETPSQSVEQVIEGEAYLEHTGPHANGLLSVLHGLRMLGSRRVFRPLQDEARDLHTTEDKNWLFTTAGREDRGSAQDSAGDGLSSRSREAGGDGAGDGRVGSEKETVLNASNYE
jgi:hypothetical protein